MELIVFNKIDEKEMDNLWSKLSLTALSLKLKPLYCLIGIVPPPTMMLIRLLGSMIAGILMPLNNFLQRPKSKVSLINGNIIEAHNKGRLEENNFNAFKDFVMEVPA